MKRYKQNLRVDENKVFSYNTHVATIKGGLLLIHGYWSMTTSKHINYVASQYNLTKVKEEKPKEEKEEENNFKSVGMIAALGDLFCNSQKEKNNWKIRMLKAGMENKGLIIPDDWETLTEEEKEKRLNGVIKISQEDIKKNE